MLNNHPPPLTNSFAPLILKHQQHKNQWTCTIKRVDYVARRLRVVGQGYAGARQVAVISAINLGTPDRMKVFAGDIATVERQHDHTYICIAVRRKLRCATSSDTPSDAEVNTSADEETSNSYVMQDYGATYTPLDLTIPQFEPLGDLSLPTDRLPETLCGIELCCDAAPIDGQFLMYNASKGCLEWHFRGGATGLLWILYNSDNIYRIDSLAPGGGTATSLSGWLTNAYGHGRYLSPSSDVLLNVLEANTTPEQIWHSTDSGTTYSSVKNLQNIAGAMSDGYIKTDLLHRSIQWTSLYDATTEVSNTLKTYIQNHLTPGNGTFAANTLEPYSIFRANEIPAYVYWTTDNGLTWTGLLVNYACQVGSARPVNNAVPMYVGALPAPSPYVVGLENSLSVWVNVQIKDYTAFTVYAGGGATTGKVVSPLWASIIVAPLHNGTQAYVLASAFQGQEIYNDVANAWITGFAPQTTVHADGEVRCDFMLVNTSGAVVSEVKFRSPYDDGFFETFRTPVKAAASPIHPEKICISWAYDRDSIADRLGIYDYVAQTNDDHSSDLSGANVMDIVYGSDGTLYILDDSPGFYYSTDDATLHYIYLPTATGVSNFILSLGVTATGIVTIPLDDGRFVYTSDKGVTWNTSAVLAIDVAATSDILISIEGI